MKALLILLLAFVVFGSGAYFVWDIFVRPGQELEMERRQPPAPAPPDPTIPEFEKVVAVKETGNLLEARTALGDFIERFPESTKLDEARDHLGEINARIFLSPYPAPEKEVYLVRSGDVLDRVARQMKTTSELIVRANNLQPNAKGNIILQIGQKLSIPKGEFSLGIERGRQRVVLRNGGHFFKQYPIRVMPPGAPVAARKAGPAPKPVKLTGKVADKVAWKDGTRITVTEKGYPEADHWIVIAPSGHSLFTEHVPGDGSQFQKPPGGGYALAPEQMRELAAMLRKSDSVSIE